MFEINHNENVQLAANASVSAMLTLFVGGDTKGITNFSFDLTIAGVA